MTESNVDTDFVDGLQLIIDSLIKEDESDIFEESTAIEKALPLAAVGGAIAGAVGQAVKFGGGASGGAIGAATPISQGGVSLNRSDTDEKGERLGKNSEGIEDVGERVSHNGASSHLPQDKRPLDTSIVGGGQIKHQTNIQNADENELPEANHWCPDVMDWHTSDHEPAKAPSVHINVDNHNGDDPYKSENADKDVDKSFLPNPGKPPPISKPKVEKGGYDQNTNLPPEFGKPEEGESVAEPFLRKREDAEEDIEKQEGSTPSDMGTSETAVSMAMAREYNQSIDVLKIWASVDRVLPKDDELSLVDDLSILKSFGLETFTNIEDLVEGTLVHKMLVDRASRPTKEWWESGIKLAESVEGMEEPAICTAFLYYEPDTFDMRDFQKANSSMSSDRATRHGETQDMQNVGSASAIDGLGMSADELEKLDVNVMGPKDEDCDK